MSKFEHPLTVAITVLSSEQLTAVYALLGGASLAAVAVSGSGKPVSVQPSPTSDAPAASATEAAPAAASTETAPAGDPNEVDAGGHPWSADLHASTRGTTKDGYWRMKVGVSRPADLPGFPKGTGTDTATSPTSASGQGATQADPAPASTADDDDEFAAFRAAARKRAFSRVAVSESSVRASTHHGPKSIWSVFRLRAYSSPIGSSSRN